MNNVYIDIGAKRIQSWISKPLKLKYVRGASLKLSEETSKDRIERWLGRNSYGRFSIADEAGDIDGVVVLKAATSDVDDKQVNDVANALLMHLNDRLPTVEWEGWSCTASSFIAAYHEAEVSKNPEHTFKLQPAVMEFTGARLCQGCEMELATRDARHVQEYLGPDCIDRLNKSEVNDAEREKALQQAKMKQYGDELSKVTSENLSERVIEGWPDDFEELANLRGNFASANGENPNYKKRPRNHIATICADGNRVGALFNALSEHEELGEFKTRAIGALDRITNYAVDKAIVAVQANDSKSVVLKHYIGGDDVLVSTTADEAWSFAIGMIREFEACRIYFESELEETRVPEDKREKIIDLINGISLGVGIVFSNYAHPFYVCRDKAEEAMKRAKSVTLGKESAICWADLTEDGGESRYTQGSHWITYSDAESQKSDDGNLPFIMKLNSSAQHNLRNQWIRWLDEDDLAGRRPNADESKKYEKYIKDWLKRIGKIADADDDTINISIDTVEADLHRARWWPYVAEDEGNEVQS